MFRTLIRKRQPQETMLIFAMIGMSVAFLFLTVSYLLRKDTAGWIPFTLPKAFAFSTFFMLISSYTLYVANVSFKKEDFFTYRYMLGVTFLLGLVFIFCQVIGWRQLEAKGLFFVKGSISVGFLYILSGLHILHLLGGLIALGILLRQAIRKIDYVDAFVYSVNPPNQRRLYLSTLYWHFLDVVWLYLYVFFYVQH
ncbi:MAG: cytochrome c oxidase subunit 3 [Raineya sp.]